MNALDGILLARIQFATNISFHILFPTISIGLGWALLYFKLKYRRTQDEQWMAAYRLWVKIFALTFALGVVSGVTMSFQFGTNWPGYMRTFGNVAGPLLAYEVLTAFFLEATFLSIMLFGTKRVSDRVHTLATLLVAAGTTFSAFWIIALNSWMQTPAGFVMRAGKAHPVDWFALVFSPSLPYRLTHMLLASAITVCFLLAGVSAYRWMRGDRSSAVHQVFRLGSVVALILVPLQILVGDLHGLNTLEHQPAKIAAIEGLWDSETGAPLLLFAILDEKRQTNDFAIAIPRLASLILTHSADGEIKGLKEFGTDRPPVAPVFWAFRVMVATGIVMLLLSALTVWRRRRDRPLPSVPFARAWVSLSFVGWIATLSGWYVAEIGRQPWLVQGVLRARDAASAVPAPFIAISLSMYLALYAALIGAYVWVVFYLARRAGDAHA